MVYRIKIYIAADWDGDKNAVEQLYKWKKSNYWSLDFHDAHDLTQARDSSLNCSIKSSLATRLDVSKTFVLIGSYNSWTQSCARGHSVDYRSYIEYECEKAIRDGLKIVVLYNAGSVNKSKCPDSIKYHGTHVAMWKWENGQYYWDYQSVKRALE